MGVKLGSLGKTLSHYSKIMTLPPKVLLCRAVKPQKHHLEQVVQLTWTYKVDFEIEA